MDTMSLVLLIVGSLCGLFLYALNRQETLRLEKEARDELEEARESSG